MSPLRATVSALTIYPIKGCRGLSVDAFDLDVLGPVDDRRYMIIDASGRFLSQRSHPTMAQIVPRLSATHLTLSGPGAAPVTVPKRRPEAAAITVSVWSSYELVAEDVGDDAASWLSDILQTPCRLVHTGSAFDRRCSPENDALGFADGYPMLVASEASLTDLNERLIARGEAPLPMDRFRPNIVVRDCDAFAEDGWPRFRLGDVRMRSAGPCARCSVTTTDQQTSERGIEPLRTLATYRRDPGQSRDVNFGQNLIAEELGTVRVGDRLVLLAE